jgi:hypothetical protein
MRIKSVKIVLLMCICNVMCNVYFPISPFCLLAVVGAKDLRCCVVILCQPRLVECLELPYQLKESTFVPIHKKGDKTYCSNYRGISLLSMSDTVVSNILSRLSLYVDEIIGDHQCGFRRNGSTTDHIFCIRQILEKQWEYNETVHQLFTDFKIAYDSVRREVLYNILIEFGVPMKDVRHR